MDVYFCDASGIAKRYVQETGTAWVQSLAIPAAGNDLYLARITTVEVVSAVTRRQRGGHLSAAAAAGILEKKEKKKGSGGSGVFFTAAADLACVADHGALPCYVHVDEIAAMVADKNRCPRRPNFLAFAPQPATMML